MVINSTRSKYVIDSVLLGMLWMFPLAYYKMETIWWILVLLTALPLTFYLVSFTGIKKIKITGDTLIYSFPTRPVWMKKEIIISLKKIRAVKCYQAGVDQSSFFRLFYGNKRLMFYSDYAEQIELLSVLSKYKIHFEFEPVNGTLHQMWKEYEKTQ